MNQDLVSLIRKITYGLITSFIIAGFLIGWVNSLLLHIGIITLGMIIKLVNMYRFDPTTRKKKKRDGGLSGLLC